MSTTGAETSNESLSRIAALLALAGAAVMVVLALIDHEGWGWLIQPVLGLAAVVTAWRAGGSSPKNMIAFLALLVGAILVVVFLGFVIAEA